MLHSMVIYLAMTGYIELVGSLHMQVTEIRIHVCKIHVCSKQRNGGTTTIRPVLTELNLVLWEKLGPNYAEIHHVFFYWGKKNYKWSYYHHSRLFEKQCNILLRLRYKHYYTDITCALIHRSAVPNLSPQRSRIYCRTFDTVEDSHWSSLFLKDCILWKGSVLDQLVKNCNSWEEPMLKKFLKDCFLK